MKQLIEKSKFIIFCLSLELIPTVFLECWGLFHNLKLKETVEKNMFKQLNPSLPGLGEMPMYHLPSRWNGRGLSNSRKIKTQEFTAQGEGLTTPEAWYEVDAYSKFLWSREALYEPRHRWEWWGKDLTVIITLNTIMKLSFTTNE